MNTGVLNVAVWHCCDSSDHVGFADEDTSREFPRVYSSVNHYQLDQCFSARPHLLELNYQSARAVFSVSDSETHTATG